MTILAKDLLEFLHMLLLLGQPMAAAFECSGLDKHLQRVVEGPKCLQFADAP